MLQLGAPDHKGQLTKGLSSVLKSLELTGRWPLALCLLSEAGAPSESTGVAVNVNLESQWLIIMVYFTSQ